MVFCIRENCLILFFANLVVCLILFFANLGTVFYCLCMFTLKSHADGFRLSVGGWETLIIRKLVNYCEQQSAALKKGLFFSNTVQRR